MKFQKLTAILRTERLAAVEENLRRIGVKGVSITHVVGFGEYANFFSTKWHVRHARVEIFVRSEERDSILNTILDAAHSGVSGDGLIAVLPVEKIIRIKTRREAAPGEI